MTEIKICLQGISEISLSKITKGKNQRKHYDQVTPKPYFMRAIKVSRKNYSFGKRTRNLTAPKDSQRITENLNSVSQTLQIMAIPTRWSLVYYKISVLVLPQIRRQFCGPF